MACFSAIAFYPVITITVTEGPEEGHPAKFYPCQAPWLAVRCMFWCQNLRCPFKPSLTLVGITQGFHCDPYYGDPALLQGSIAWLLERIASTKLISGRSSLLSAIPLSRLDMYWVICLSIYVTYHDSYDWLRHSTMFLFVRASKSPCISPGTYGKQSVRRAKYL